MKPLVWAAGAGLLMSIASLGVWLYVNDNGSDVFFGRVNTVATSTIVLQDRHGEAVAVRIASTTTVWKGKDTLTVEDIRVGDFVQVSGVRAGASEITAESIRLMKAPPEKRDGKQPSRP